MGREKSKTAWGASNPQNSRHKDRQKSAGIEKRNVFSHLPAQSDLTALELLRVQCYMSGYKLMSTTVGSGAYAKVYLAEVTSEKTIAGPDVEEEVSLRQTNPMVAVKVIDKNIIPSSFLRKFIPRELENHRRLSPHPNVVRCFEHFSSGDHVFVILEYCERGDLLQFINDSVKQNKMMSRDLIKTIFKQICLGLQHLHSECVVHRDLKCENILISKDLCIKITDLGFSCRVDDKDAILRTSCGSYTYAAPEVIASKLYNGFKADIWSLGVILFAMANGRLPFTERLLTGMNEQMKKQVLLFEDHVSSDCSLLVQRILQYDPERRPSLTSILSDRWLNDRNRKSGSSRMINRPRWENSYTNEKEQNTGLSVLRIGKASPRAATAEVPRKTASPKASVSHPQKPKGKPRQVCPHTPLIPCPPARQSKSAREVKPIMAKFLTVVEERERIKQTKARLTVTADPQCFRYVPKWFFQRMLQANDKLKTYYSKPKCKWVSSEKAKERKVYEDRRSKTIRNDKIYRADGEPMAPRSTPEPRLLGEVVTDPTHIKPLKKAGSGKHNLQRSCLSATKSPPRAKSCMARITEASARVPVLLVTPLPKPKISDGSAMGSPYHPSSCKIDPPQPGKGGHLHTRSSQLRCQLAKAKLARYPTGPDSRLRLPSYIKAWQGDAQTT